MRRGVAKSVARVGNTMSDHCSHGIGYILARSALYEALAVLGDGAALVVRVIHIQSLISIRDEVQDCPIVVLRFRCWFRSNGCADENRRMDVV